VKKLRALHLESLVACAIRLMRCDAQLSVETAVEAALAENAATINSKAMQDKIREAIIRVLVTGKMPKRFVYNLLYDDIWATRQ
jgi:hypothetical protein